MFRSLLVPLKAAVLNLLSIAAALGAITLVFQEGHFGIEDPGPMEAFMPVMVFAIVFGLSMDYEVFLVSRMHEDWDNHRDGTAIRQGLANTGQVVIAAAAIMIAVFSAFMFDGDRMLQQFGLGMAVAVFVDGVIIRLMIVPAAMQLMGRRAWWIPAGLDRRLPKLNIEKH